MSELCDKAVLGENFSMSHFLQTALTVVFYSLHMENEMKNITTGSSRSQDFLPKASWPRYFFSKHGNCVLEPHTHTPEGFLSLWLCCWVIHRPAAAELCLLVSKLVPAPGLQEVERCVRSLCGQLLLSACCHIHSD